MNINGKSSRITLSVRDIPLRKHDKENPRDFSQRTPSGTVIKGTHDDPFLPPLPYPIQTYRTCVMKDYEKVIFGMTWAPDGQNGLDSMKRMNIPSPTKSTPMRAIFSDITCASLIRESAFIKHFTGPIDPGSPSVAQGNDLYIPTTYGWFKYNQTSILPYQIDKDYPADYFYFTPELKRCQDNQSYEDLENSLLPLPIVVIGVCLLPIVLPTDHNAVYTQQFLIVEDPFPLSGSLSEDIDLVIDIEGFATGAFWPHPWGSLPVVEKGRHRVHLNSRGMVEAIAISVMKAYNEETHIGTVGTAVWFGRGSVFNHGTTVEVNFQDQQYHMLNTKDDILQMVALTFGLEKVAAMFTEMGVVLTGVNMAIPSQEVIKIVTKLGARKIIPAKNGWSWLAVIEFLRKLRYTIETEFLDVSKWEQLAEVIAFATLGEKKLNKDMVYNAVEVWHRCRLAEKKGMKWANHGQDSGKQLLKDLEEIPRWEESKKSVHEVHEADWRLRGWPTFIEIGKMRKRLDEAVPRICENTAF
ncbi:hypothetical protein TWF970_009779 [Orbilia oligospora]|uniref:Uncharacterized protein n=1 Tax=Orbilia oligospora TaxID=2813651 RepID=A0A7C8RJ19_ORBOL|nr:hypothetical protein TWF970_009779 [Orbilia oligospora]